MLKAFEKNNYDRKSELDCLEIGSWQGMSAFFTLSHFENARLTCVDTWQGSDEHKFLDQSFMTPEHVLKSAEAVFDRNLKKYKRRLNKWKGTSFEYFNDNFKRDKFDIIYVDGSHHCDDVMVDGIKAFEMLKTGGLIIFDNYFWRYYNLHIDNPCGAKCFCADEKKSD